MSLAPKYKSAGLRSAGHTWPQNHHRAYFEEDTLIQREQDRLFAMGAIPD